MECGALGHFYVCFESITRESTRPRNLEKIEFENPRFRQKSQGIVDKVIFLSKPCDFPVTFCHKLSQEKSQGFPVTI